MSKVKVAHHLKKVVEILKIAPRNYLINVDLVVQTLVSLHKDYEFESPDKLRTTVAEVLSTMV